MKTNRIGLWLLAALLATGCAQTRAVDQDQDWVLTIGSAQSHWATGEAILVRTELRYIGPGKGTEWFGSSSGQLAFDLREINGTRHLEGGMLGDCSRHEMRADDPLVVGYRKPGGYSADDPHAAFYREFLADPLLHLPPGEWELAARAVFSMPPGCGAGGGRTVSLRASVVVTVE